MTRLSSISLIILFFLTASPTQLRSNPLSGDTAIFRWETGACTLTGKYDSKKYSETVLRNTYDLWVIYSALMLQTDGIVFKPEDIQKLDLKKLTNEYQAKKERIERAEIINTAYWIALKQQRLQELDAEYEHMKTTLQAYTDPATLLTASYAQFCPEVVQVLTSGDTAVLLSYWKDFAEKQKLKNGFPEKFMERFYAKYNSQNKLEYAKVDLITFDLSNCINHNISNKINQDEKMEKEFNKLFKDITSECDEP